MAEQTFSESWYRIANQRIHLRPGVNVSRQNYRGERWMVLEDPFANSFFRMRPEAYEFVARLRPDRTVEEVWRECIERFPDTAPGQQAVIQLLSQLYHSNLLQYNLAADSAQLFERQKKRKQRETRAKLLSIMFMRIPLFDPDRLLVRTMPLVGKFISWFGALIWLVVVGMAGKVVIDNFDLAMDQSQAVLDPGNIFLLYLGMVITKTLHEFGHAYFCRKFGGEVHRMGIMLLVFTPIPFMDATSSWGFRSRWKRMLVAAAGMIVEVFVAAIAVFVWYRTGSGTLHNLAYNMMFVASVSTLLFNINPLLRFDGYYILSDLLEIPNLHQRAARHLRHLIEHYLFGVKKSESPARSRREAFWLTVFGILSNIYKVVVFTGILLFVADRWLLLGLLMAALCIVSWLIAPIVKLVNYLSSNPRLERCRPRAIAVVSLFFAAVIALLQFIPFPSHFRAPGVVEATRYAIVLNDAAGNVEELLVQPGAQVKEGQPLLRLSNPELDLSLNAAQAELAEVDARIRAARQADVASLKPLASRRESAVKTLDRIRSDMASLTVKARMDGVWVAPGMQGYQGRWLVRGSSLGLLVDPSSFQFAATVSQDDVNNLFDRDFEGAEIRLFGEAERKLTFSEVKVIPADQHVLPSPALGWAAGGEMQTAADDPEGNRTVEPYFKVIGKIDGEDAPALLHGRTGKIRFNTGEQALLPRWYRRFRQMIQRRYQL